MRIDDTIDPSVGFIADVRIGDRVSDDVSLGTIYCSDEAKAQEAAARIQAGTKLATNPLMSYRNLLRR